MCQCRYDSNLFRFTRPKNPCVKKNPKKRLALWPTRADRSAWLLPTRGKTRWFLLAVRSGSVRSRPAAVMVSLQELRWVLVVARTMHSREEPEPHWAIVGAERRSTCSPGHDVGARGMTVHGVNFWRQLNIWRQEIGIRLVSNVKKEE